MRYRHRNPQTTAATVFLRQKCQVTRAHASRRRAGTRSPWQLRCEKTAGSLDRFLFVTKVKQHLEIMNLWNNEFVKHWCETLMYLHFADIRSVKPMLLHISYTVFRKKRCHYGSSMRVHDGDREWQRVSLSQQPERARTFADIQITGIEYCKGWFSKSMEKEKKCTTKSYISISTNRCDIFHGTTNGLVSHVRAPGCVLLGPVQVEQEMFFSFTSFAHLKFWPCFYSHQLQASFT